MINNSLIDKKHCREQKYFMQDPKNPLKDFYAGEVEAKDCCVVTREEYFKNIQRAIEKQEIFLIEPFKIVNSKKTVGYYWLLKLRTPKGEIIPIAQSPLYKTFEESYKWSEKIKRALKRAIYHFPKRKAPLSCVK